MDVNEYIIDLPEDEVSYESHGRYSKKQVRALRDALVALEGLNDDE